MPDIAQAPRSAEVVRNTLETRIRAAIHLDGSGRSALSTGIGFLDHMLDQIARHGLFDLEIEAQGDLHIDGHVHGATGCPWWRAAGRRRAGRPPRPCAARGRRP